MDGIVPSLVSIMLSTIPYKSSIKVVRSKEKSCLTLGKGLLELRIKRLLVG